MTEATDTTVTQRTQADATTTGQRKVRVPLNRLHTPQQLDSQAAALRQARRISKVRIAFLRGRIERSNHELFSLRQAHATALRLQDNLLTSLIAGPLRKMTANRIPLVVAAIQANKAELAVLRDLADVRQTRIRAIEAYLRNGGQHTFDKLNAKGKRLYREIVRLERATAERRKVHRDRLTRRAKRSRDMLLKGNLVLVLSRL